jgi:hypothetical protein
MVDPGTGTHQNNGFGGAARLGLGPHGEGRWLQTHVGDFKCF